MAEETGVHTALDLQIEVVCIVKHFGALHLIGHIAFQSCDPDSDTRQPPHLDGGG